jgi:hypothetical protein
MPGKMIRTIESCFCMATLFCATSLFAQSDDWNALYWEPQKLEWADFRGTPIKNSPFYSELSYFIGYKPKKFKVDDLAIEALVTYCYMDRSISWAKEEPRDPVLLLYNQTIFDIAELYSRKLQYKLNQLSGSVRFIGSQADEALTNTYRQCRQRLSAFAEESNYGRDSEVVRVWSQTVTHELNQTPRQTMPDYSTSKIGLGAAGGTGYGIITNSLHDHFANSLNVLNFGFDFAYGQFILFAWGTLGINHVKTEYRDAETIWTKNLKTNFTIVEATLGYPIIDRSRWKISPFGGVGGVELTVRGKDKQYEDFRLVKTIAVYGVNCDYKFSKRLSLVGSVKERTDWFIRTRLYFAAANFADDLKGSSINFSVSVGGFGRFARVRP